MVSLDSLKSVIEQSAKSVQLSKEHFSSGLAARSLRGAKFDKKLRASLKSPEDASKLFNMSELADQQ